MACEELLAGEGERLTRKAITLALKANTIALKLCLDRIVPIRGARLKLDVPHIETPADVMQALGAVMKAASSGVISAEEASQLASIIGHQRQALELGELAARVTALETAEAQRGDA